MFKDDSRAPVIEFTTQQDELIEIIGSASKPPRYKVGDQVKLLYTPESPVSAVIDSFLEKWALSTFLLSFSMVTVLTGGIMLLVLLNAF